MPRLFYKGKLSLLLKFGMISNNFIAWMNGNSRDKDTIRKRIQDGYDGLFSDDVTKYDELTLDHYTELADSLLNKIDCKDKVVLDVGCGTGALTHLLLEQGAAKVVCVDFSKHMLDQCKKKFDIMKYPSDRIEYKQADAEKLPFEDNTFDLVVSGMILGLAVDQEKIISEMNRVIKQGGEVAISTHGPEWYYEIVESLGMCLLRYYPMTNIGSSSGTEFWPITENVFQNMLKKEGFVNTKIKSQRGQLSFKNGGEAWDFFAACSSAYFLELFKPEERLSVIQTIRNYFLNKNITTVTYDALMGYGKKV